MLWQQRQLRGPVCWGLSAWEASRSRRETRWAKTLRVLSELAQTSVSAPKNLLIRGGTVFLGIAIHPAGILVEVILNVRLACPERESLATLIKYETGTGPMTWHMPVQGRALLAENFTCRLRLDHVSTK